MTDFSTFQIIRLVPLDEKPPTLTPEEEELQVVLDTVRETDVDDETMLWALERLELYGAVGTPHSTQLGDASRSASNGLKLLASGARVKHYSTPLSMTNFRFSSWSSTDPVILLADACRRRVSSSSAKAVQRSCSLSGKWSS